MSSEHNRPDYILAVMDTETEARNPNIGAAWKQADGSIKLKIDLGCVVSYDPVLSYRLFPNNRREQS